MNAFQLKEWFEWKSLDTTGHYVKQTLKGMAEKKGREKNSFVMRALRVATLCIINDKNFHQESSLILLLD